MKTTNTSAQVKSKSFGAMGKKAPRFITHDLSIVNTSKPKTKRINKKPKALRGKV
jgi:hypothetical protein